MPDMKLSTILVPLLLAMILTVLFMLAYDSLKPSIKQDHNFVPLSQRFPDDLSKEAATNSCNTLSRCIDGSCKHCDPSYVCTQIGYDEKVYMNGEKVPAGMWCLPPGKTEVACGPATGRAIWTGQKWTCACLYPDMYAGQDCTTQIACKVPNAPGVDQSGNTLIHRDTGEVYDVMDTTTTPYDTDADGNPLYVCKCDSTQTKKFTALPQDPYRCHLEPCSDDHEIPFWDAENSKCDCTAKGAVNNEYAYSNISGKCVRTPQCAWNDSEQKCMCPEGQVSYTCNSSTMKRTTTTAGPCPDVPGGSFCKNPCEGYCLNGGIGTIVGDKCVCKCPLLPEIELRGPRCDDPCMKSGVSEPSIKCCSGTVSRRFGGDMWYPITWYVCD